MVGLPEKVIGRSDPGRASSKSPASPTDALAIVIGAVLNRVDLKHHPYYYSRYYRGNYAEYYQRDQRSAS